MKKSKFSEAQIVKILGEVSSGKPAKEVCSAHGVSEATFYVWRRKYAGMENEDLRRPRELEKENEALKLLLAERDLEIRAVKAEGIPVRRACFVMGVSTASPYRKPKADQDAEPREKLRATWRPNVGYRMAHALVRKAFAPLNVKRVHRIWKEERLGRMRRRRKKRTGETVPLAATRPNPVGCLDLVFDACLNGTKLKALAVKDEFTKGCLALEVRTRFRSADVRRVLEACLETYGTPGRLRSDNGGEFIARTLAAFLSQSGTGAHFIEPGSPWRSGFIESFNSRLRAECLDVEVFHSLADAPVKLAVYRRWHNEERPHSSIGNLPPAAFRTRRSDSGRATPSLRPNIAMTTHTQEREL